jgi:hypothetical protein
MGWFLDTLLGYVMTHVVDVEYRRLKNLLGDPAAGKSRADGTGISKSGSISQGIGKLNLAADQTTGHDINPSYLDFTTLRNIHNTYLERLLTGCLLSNPALMSIIRPVFEVCERFVAQVERWGGDVLPALLFEGSIADDSTDSVGAMVKERWAIVAEINEVIIPLHISIHSVHFEFQTLHTLLEAFYEQLVLSTSQQPFTAVNDASKSILMNASIANASSFHHTFIRRKGAKGLEGDGEVRRHIERLLLRLDFNGGFSKVKHQKDRPDEDEILKQGGL